MRITVIAVGKVKEKYFRDAAAEYAKRLGRYAKLEIREVADEKTPEGAGEKEETAIRDREAARILAQIRKDDFVITLEIGGRPFSSEELAEKIGALGLQGKSRLTFVIGGSIGLGQEVLKRSDLALSFSAMTFPHQLMRVILLEQIYRSFTILNGTPYHK